MRTNNISIDKSSHDVQLITFQSLRQKHGLFAICQLLRKNEMSVLPNFQVFLR